MVKFGLPVFLRFGLMVKYSFFRFSYDWTFRIWPNGPVRFSGTKSVSKSGLNFSPYYSGRISTGNLLQKHAL